MAGALIRLGVRHVFGVGGANIEDMFLAVQRRRPRIMTILGKHEYSAGAAADAYARVTRSLGVVMTTSGGGAMNVVPALAESLASRVPVLAIVGEPPTNVQGLGAFQDTSGRGGAVDAQTVLRGVAVSCERATGAQDLPALVESAARIAVERSAPAVILVAKDLQQAPIDRAGITELIAPIKPLSIAADPTVIAKAGRALTHRPVVIVAGDEVCRTGAQPDLQRLASMLEARVTVTPDGRAAFDNLDPRFAGVIGAMGHPSAAHALAEARVCLLVGTRLPILARQGRESIFAKTALVSIARDEPFITAQDAIHVGGNLVANIRALLSELEDARRGNAQPLTRPPTLASDSQIFVEPSASFGSESILGMIERTLPDNAVVLVDAGNTGAHAIHHLRAPRCGHWLVAMGMAGMGYTFGGAIGAAFGTGGRALVLAGDGAFFMHGLDIHTAVEHQLPISYVIFDNRAHGMCLLRERLLLEEEAGYNVFRPSNIGAGLAAMFPGLASWDCHSLDDLERALSDSAIVSGPSVICAHLPDVEVPPFSPFRSALAARGGATGSVA
jgi:acetolactate synthase-1/2/3 large subunit